MKKLSALKPFLIRSGVRFGISLVVLGIGYGLIFGFTLHKKTKPPVGVQKLAALRSALDNTYISQTAVASMSDYSPAGAYTISTDIAQFTQDIPALKTALQNAPASVTPDVRNKIQSYINQASSASTQLAAAETIFGQVIGYDPSTDLAVTLPAKNSELATRAKAAANGLTSLATSQKTIQASTANDTAGVGVQSSGNTLVVASSTSQILTTEAACFSKIQTQITTKQTDQAKATRASCISNYENVRKAATQNLISVGLAQSFMTSSKTIVSSSLAAIDALLKPATNKE